MKKILLFILLFLLSVTANADDSGSCGENVTYTFSDATKTLTISGNGEMDRFRGHGWSINDKDTPWKLYQDEILHVVIESNVTNIGEGSFWGCSNLKTVTIPSTITNIKSAAFMDCTKLEGVYISDLESWCNITFGAAPTRDTSSNPLYYAHNLYINGEKIKQLVIPEGISEIKTCSFCGFSEMTSLLIPNSVKSINGSAFEGCKKLTDLNIPNSVTIIASYAFAECEALTTVNLSEKLEEIQSYAFQNCTSLFSIVIPNSVTTLYDTFNGCTGLTYVTLSNNLKKVLGFYGCSSLTSIVLPEGVESIEPLAFYGCSNLSSITIPSSLTSIDDNAFRGCSKLKTIKLTDIAKWCVVEFKGDYCNPFQWSYGGKIYKNDEEILDLEIPDGVTTISANAFNYCTSIKSVKMPQSVNQIGEQAFANCYNLENVEMSDNLQKLENKTFYGCKIKNVTIPSSVQYIYSQVFDACYSLESVSVKAETPPFLNHTAFSTYNIPLYVPYNSVETYKSTNPWCQFEDIKPMSEVISQCATPKISISKGQLTFQCETEDVKFVYNVVPVSSISGEGENVSLPTNTTYRITVYATKDGYEDSDVATEEIEVSPGGIKGDVNEDGKVNGTDIQEVINIIVNAE